MKPPIRLVPYLLFSLLLPLFAAAPAAAQAPDLSARAEIRRTAYGVPHIRADDLRAAGYALAWVQMEDYGVRVPHGLTAARGELARHFGPDSLNGAFARRAGWLHAVRTYTQLDGDTRAMYEGFAQGVNRFVELYPERFPAWMRPDYTGYDVHAVGVGRVTPWGLDAMVERLAQQPGRIALRDSVPDPDVGSNAWALGPSRTRSGNAILLRNPHLGWDAGYYEGHLVVPGRINFYGDFRIGSPLGIIGGFNARLGWSTTNNDTDTDEVYALDADPARPDHVLLDGASLPLAREVVEVQVRNGDGLSTERREFWSSPLGPVLHRAHGQVYVYRSARLGEFRAGEQFLRMMQAHSLDEWKAAMRIRGRGASNFTYADADGNIFYVWNAALPQLPHRSGGDTIAVPASSTSHVWTRLVPWDSLPQLQNPASGYLHNENDSPHYSNLEEQLDPARFPANHEQPRLRLRSQLALELLQGADRLSLEEVVRLKHSPRMLLADRVKPALLDAVRRSGPAPEVARAAELLAAWDNTAAADSRGALLFEAWWHEYTREADADTVFAEPWTPARPTETPRGLRDADRAAAAFAEAVRATAERHGSWDIAWGEVHRVRRGEVDLPVSGCSGALGCFRVLWFEEQPDGRRAVRGGDGWVFAVEFGEQPRAYSVLAYGQSPDPASPHHDDQAALFAEGRMKPIAFTPDEVERSTVRRYRPGVRADPAR